MSLIDCVDVSDLAAGELLELGAVLVVIEEPAQAIGLPADEMEGRVDR
jgi:hypothetical protein